MRCYYHIDREAVALCKACNRGLCADCAADVPPGTACKNRCEAEVASVNLVIERSKSAYQKTGRAYRRSGWAILILGSLLTGFGLLPIIQSRDYGAALLVPLGLVFVFYSLGMFRNARQIEAVKGIKKTAEPNATDNPDGAQRLREDH